MAWFAATVDAERAVGRHAGDDFPQRRLGPEGLGQPRDPILSRAPAIGAADPQHDIGIGRERGLIFVRKNKEGALSRGCLSSFDKKTRQREPGRVGRKRPMGLPVATADMAATYTGILDK